MVPLLGASCERTEVLGVIPNVTINLTINLTNQAYLDLQPGGLGFVFVPDEGYRGLVIYRVSSTNYRVFDRACTYDPNADCGQVEAQVGGFGLQCRCAGASQFNWEGQPTGGPASFPLRPYATFLEGNLLTVVN